jgi:hypothetical protein
VCSSCGKKKQLAGSHLSGKTEVNSDCWPCGRKRIFKLRIKPSKSVKSPAADEKMPRASSGDDGAAAAAASAAVTGGAVSSRSVSPRTAPTAHQSLFPSERSGSASPVTAGGNTAMAAAAAFRSWASSKVGFGPMSSPSPPPPPPVTTVQRAASQATLTNRGAVGGAFTSATTGPGGSGHSVTPTLTFAKAPAAAFAAPLAPSHNRTASADDQSRGRSGAPKFGLFSAASQMAPPNSRHRNTTSATGAPPQFRLPSPISALHNTSSSPDRAAVATSRSASVGAQITLLAATAGGQQPPNTGGAQNGAATILSGIQAELPRWLCQTCSKAKPLQGPHLAGKTTVHSDCWPCGRKRVFILTQPQPLSNGSMASPAATVTPDAPTGAAAGSPDMPPCGTSTASPDGTAVQAAASLSTGAWQASPLLARGNVDLQHFMQRVFVHMHLHAIHGVVCSGLSGQNVAMRPCPPPQSAQHLPLLLCLEASALGTSEQFVCPTRRQGAAPTPEASSFGHPQWPSSPLPRTASPAESRGRSIETLACLAARLGPAITAAAMQLTRPGAAFTSPQTVKTVAVFCHSHDELAATAAYFAMAGGGLDDRDALQPLRFRVLGPPPEFTTSRTIASDLLSALTAQFGADCATVTPPVTHGDRHKAVKYIAKRCDSLFVSPGGAVGFAVADRAHLQWQQRGERIPDHSLVVLGRPARWQEIDKVLKVVDALKIKDQPTMSPKSPTEFS